MNETSNNWLSTTGTTTLGYSGNINELTTNSNSGLTLAENSTLTYKGNLGWSTAVTHSNNMTPKQVHVAVFTIKRDKDTNEINSTTFLKELWVEQKNGTSIDLLVAKHLDKDFDPEKTIIKVLTTISF